MRAARTILTALVPAVTAVALAGHLFTATPRQAVPVVNDEVAYWNQVAAFERAGFSGGYHTINEVPARATFSRFGPHGPMYPALYGFIARAFGWRPYSSPIVSMVLVTAAAAAWCGTAGSLAWAALALATFWPLILFLPSTYQESFHFALAFALAAAIRRRIASPSQPIAWTAVILACLVAALFRPTWAFVAIPCAWLATREQRPAVRVAAIVAVCAGVALVSAIFAWLVAPYPGALFNRLSSGPIALLWMVPARAARSIPEYLDPRGSEPMVMLIRYEVLAMLAGAVYVAARSRDRAHAAAVFVAILLAITVASVLAGSSLRALRDVRAVAPALLTGLLVWLPERHRFPRAMVLVNALAAPIAISTFAQWHAPRYHKPDKAPYVSRALGGRLQFEENASGWANTILMHADAVDEGLVALPHGIAISVVLAWEDVSLPLRSRYLLLRASDREALGSRVPLTHIADTPIGTVYLNAAWHEGRAARR